MGEEEVGKLTMRREHAETEDGAHDPAAFAYYPSVASVGYTALLLRLQLRAEEVLDAAA